MEAPYERLRREVDVQMARIGASLQQKEDHAGTIARILRAHLVVERCLREHISAANPRLGPLEPLHLNFDRLRRIVVGMQDFGVPWLSEPIKALNRIRNHLAHRLDGEIRRNDLLALANVIADMEGAPTPDELADDPGRTSELFAAFVGLVLASIQQLHLEKEEMENRARALDRKAYRLLTELSDEDAAAVLEDRPLDGGG